MLAEDVGNLSLPAESLDVVFFFTVLHHLENPQRGFQEATRIFRPGGQGTGKGTRYAQ
ncbi:MAG: hypothetical protein Ct9H300mP21_05630 [Pseudomonadota bacterium]|nr:MAG: hypothetical protein Ct9H300mP21_05630 [Pseudomonadota bacterium]